MDNSSPADPSEFYNARAAAGGWSSRCSPATGFDTPELNALLAVWNEKARDHWPRRADFDARSLKPFLRNIAIVERVESGGARYRLRYFGSDFVRLFGEQSGRFVDEFLPPENLPRWTLAYETVLLAGLPMRFTAEFAIPRISFLKAESFSAPLAAEAGMGSMLLTAMYVTPKADLAQVSASSP
jgi:hypothetical protein